MSFKVTESTYQEQGYKLSGLETSTVGPQDNLYWNKSPLVLTALAECLLWACTGRPWPSLFLLFLPTTHWHAGCKSHCAFDLTISLLPRKTYFEEVCCYGKLDEPPLHSSLNSGRKCSRSLAETPVSETLHARKHGCAPSPSAALPPAVRSLGPKPSQHITSVDFCKSGRWPFAIWVIEMESWAVTSTLNWISFLLWFIMKKPGF